MPTPVLTAGGNKQSTSKNGATDNKTVAMVPFIRASAEHWEPTGIDVSKQITTSDQDLGVQDITAYGYLRSLLVRVDVTGGSGGSGGTPTENAPFVTLKNIALTEPNGAVIHQWSTGYLLYLAYKWGGYRKGLGGDARAWNSNYTQVPATGAAWNFMLRIPVEINARDGLGSLPNQNAAATFKLRMTLAKFADVSTGGVAPTTMPTARIRVYMDAWDQPEIASSGMTNQVSPPAVNTTQFWSEQQYNYNAGQQTIQLKRVGNYIRNIVLVASRTSGTRANGDSDFPDPLTLYLDTRPIMTLDKAVFKQLMQERTGYGMNEGSAPAADSAGGLDNGVFVFGYTHDFDGTAGFENRDLWFPTQSSSRLELQGNFSNAGTLTVLTNDVAIAGSVFL